MYLKAEFKLEYISLDSDFTSSKIELSSEITKQNKTFLNFKTTINEKGISQFVVVKHGNELVFVV